VACSIHAEFSSSFVDLDDISSNVSYKRVYCISVVLYRNQNEGAAYAFECSVGLFYVQKLLPSPSLLFPSLLFSSVVL
jgi:hypothetical protein